MAQVSERTKRYLRYWTKRGIKKDIDEETDAFSDGEDEQDDYAKRKENKEVVRVINAEADALRERVARTAEFKKTIVQQDNIVDASKDNDTIRTGFAIDGLMRINDKTIDAGRSLDYSAGTSVYQTTVNSRGQNGLDQRTLKTFVSFDTAAVVERWFNAKNYKTYLVLGLMGVIVLYFGTAHVAGQLAAYL